jgi:hypothetical protein
MAGMKINSVSARKVAVAGLVIVLLGLLCLFRAPAPKHLLNDGSLVAVTSLKVGRTNIFKHGNWADKVIGPLVSTNGLHILNMRIAQPQMVIEPSLWAAPLSIEFQVDATKSLDGNEFVRPSFYRGSRIVHWGDDGYKYFEESPEWHKYSDGSFGYVTTPAYSRLSKTIHIAIEERKTPDAAWTSLAEFQVKNPHRVKEQDWTVEPFPVKKSKDGLLIELINVRVHRPKQGLHQWKDIYDQRVDYDFKVFREGQLITNWIPHRIYVIDSTGNESYNGANLEPGSGFVFRPVSRSVDPSVAWKVKGDFAPGSNFSESNVFNCKLLFPSSPFPPPAAPFVTNFQGRNISFTFLPFQDMLTVSMPKEAVSSRLLVLNVTNDKNESVTNMSAPIDQHTFSVMLNRQNIMANIFAKIAIVPNVQLEFTFKPEMEK